MGSTRMHLCLVPNWKLDAYCRDCAGSMCVKRFGGTAVDGKNLVVYDRSCFERDTALRAWKRRWAVRSRWCVVVLVDTGFADMLFV